jgi:hypothetical protein
VDTTNPVQGHAVATCCILARYDGYNGNTYIPTYYYRVVTFRICDDYINMDINKAFYSQNTYTYNSGIKTDSTIKTLGFQDIYDSHYCGL